VTKRKSRRSNKPKAPAYVDVSEHSTEEIFALVPDTDARKVRERFGDYNVKLSSQRLICFKHNPSCVCCGITGTKMKLQIGSGQQSPHFNMYAETKDGLRLMTKDHIVPKAQGGKDILSNYQTMCCKCNEFKGSMECSLEQLKFMVSVWNSGKPRKEKAITILNYLKDNDITNRGQVINKIVAAAEKEECTTQKQD